MSFRSTTGGRGLVVVDSETELAPSLNWTVSLMRDPDLGALMTQHLTTGLEPKGGREVAHAAQVVLHVKGFRVSQRKNRFEAASDFHIIEDLDRQPSRAPGDDVVHLEDWK